MPRFPMRPHPRPHTQAVGACRDAGLAPPDPAVELAAIGTLRTDYRPR